MPSAPHIEVEPEAAMIDAARRIRLGGFAPGERIAVQARLQQNDGSTWVGESFFDADEAGDVDVSTTAPVAGSYGGTSPMGLVWSMRQVGGASGEDFDQLAAQIVHLTASAQSGTASATLEQLFVAQGVQVTAVREDGVVATLFTPPGEDAHGLVVVLSGSGGGLMQARAALFAAHGYQALALGYFGAAGLPPTLSQIPLEYFEHALQWARRVLQPAFIAVAGVSRGGELALLLAATMPEMIDAVVGYVPSAVTNGVLNAGRPGEDRHAASWSWRGRHLPVLADKNPRADWRLFDDAPPPKRQTPAFLAALEDAQASARAAIAVERIGGPVMLISGRDDALWPSAVFSDMICRRLEAAGHPHAVVHLCFEDAGHTITFPYAPTTVLARAHPVSGLELAYGGTAAGNARACEDSWPAVLVFLDAMKGNMQR
jgi:dienelactone hydrolase